MPREKRSTETVQRALGRRIAELRHARGLTQEDAAARMRMLAPNYARIEQGRQNITLDTLVRIANVLDVGVADLFAAPMNPNPAKPGRPKRSAG